MHFDTKPGTSLPEMKRIVTRFSGSCCRSRAIRDAGRCPHRAGAARRGDRGARVLRAVDHARAAREPRRRRPSGPRRDASFPGTFLDLTTYLHERIDETITSDSEDLVVRIQGPNFGDPPAAVPAGRPTGSTAHRTRRRAPPVAGVHPPDPGDGQCGGRGPLWADAGSGPPPGGGDGSEASSWGRSRTTASRWASRGTAASSSRSGPDRRRARLLIDTPGRRARPARGRVAKLTGSTRPRVTSRVSTGRTRSTCSPTSAAGAISARATAAVRSRWRGPSASRSAITSSWPARRPSGQAAQKRLLELGLAAVVVIMLLLQAAFRDARLAILMFLSLPLALVGGGAGRRGSRSGRSRSGRWSGSSRCSGSRRATGS